MLGDQREALSNKALEHNYLSAFTYDQQDPYLSDILKDDHVLSNFKYQRKNNFKPGLYDCLRLFSNNHNFS